MKKCEFLFQQTFPEFFLLSPPIEALFIWVLFIKLLRGFVLLWGMTLGRVGFLLLLWKQLCVCDKQKFKLNLQIFILCVSQDQADLQAVCSGRRRTCALLNSPLPCVNKAIYHIQELKMTVEDWCQQVNWCQMWGNLIKILRQIEDRSKNQLKSCFFFPFVFYQSVKYQPHIDQDKHQYNKTLRWSPLCCFPFWFLFLFYSVWHKFTSFLTDFSPETQILNQWRQQSCSSKASQLMRKEVNNENSIKFIKYFV